MADIGYLRDICDADLPLMLDWRNAPSVRANMFTQHVITLDEPLAWWGRTHVRVDQSYFIYEHSGVAYGVVAFTSIDRESCNACWAFYADPAAPQGIGARMELLALERAFSLLKLHKVCCEVFAFNTPVLRLHQKFGFQIEGTLRDQRAVNGVHHDVVRLGLLHHEWLAVAPGMRTRIEHLARG